MLSTIGFRFLDSIPAGTSGAPGEGSIIVDTSALIPLLEGKFAGLDPRLLDRVQLPATVARSNDALFRTFAESEVTVAGIQSFMQRFAPLWAPVELGAVDAEGRLVLFVSKNLAKKKLPRDWPEQILDLRRCVQLWDLVQVSDVQRLARHIRWQADEAGRLSVSYDSHPDLKPGVAPTPPERRVAGVIVSRATDANVLASLKPGDVRSPALLYVEGRINEHLDGQLRTRVYYDHRTEAMSLLSIPLTFMTGLWLQFARAVTENKRYARCKECATWFETSIPGMRKTRVYCSDLCKVKAHVERKNRALQLKAEGWTLKEIAKELGLPGETITRWERGKK